MSKSIVTQTADLLALSEAELYKTAGTESIARQLGAGESDEDPERAGRTWWADHRERLAGVVCKTHLLKAYREGGEPFNTTLMVVSIADAIANVVVGITPLTAAALVFRFGLTRLCPEDDKP